MLFRSRLTYRFNKKKSVAVSAEPYLVHDGIHPLYIGRIRYVAQVSQRANKFNTFSMFYMIQPDVIDFGQIGTSYVLGLTYALELPDRPKDYPKLFRGNNKDKRSDDDRHTFN